MFCAEVKEFLLDYLDNELPLTLQQEVEQHLHSCLACRAELESHRTAGLLLQLRAVPEPPAEYWQETWDKIRAGAHARILPMPAEAVLRPPSWQRLLPAPWRPLMAAAALIIIATVSVFVSMRLNKAAEPEVWSEQKLRPGREFEVQPLNYPRYDDENMPSEWRRQREMINISRGAAGAMDPISKSALMVSLEGNPR